jgi:hypothetical protein
MSWTKTAFHLGLLAAFICPAFAYSDTISDAELIRRAGAVFSVKEAPGDRVLGLHNGFAVIADIRCSGNCPANTVRILHYTLPAGPPCTRLGADSAAVVVPQGMTLAPQDFCIPHVLFARRMFSDRPYQK